MTLKLHDLANTCPKKDGRNPGECQGLGCGQLGNSESIIEIRKSCTKKKGFWGKDIGHVEFKGLGSVSYLWGHIAIP